MKVVRPALTALALLVFVGCSDPVSINESEVSATTIQAAPSGTQFAPSNGRFTAPDPATKNLTIAEIVVSSVESSGEFSTLLAAVSAADLVGALSGQTIFTVFAPTDAAFAALGLNADNVGSVDGLADILLYHVTTGRLTAEIVLGKSTIGMANGGTITVDAGSAALIDAQGRSAGIVATDIAARNGIIHVIDTVVLP